MFLYRPLLVDEVKGSDANGASVHAKMQLSQLEQCPGSLGTVTTNQKRHQSSALVFQALLLKNPKWNQSSSRSEKCCGPTFHENRAFFRQTKVFGFNRNFSVRNVLKSGRQNFDSREILVRNKQSKKLKTSFFSISFSPLFRKK